MSRPNTRQAIIDAAVKLFADKGFERTTMDEVAAAAGIAKGTIFYNFKTKEDIFFTLLTEGVDDLVTIGKEKAAQEKGNTATARLEAVYDASREFLRKYSSFCSVMVSELGRVRSRWNMDPIKMLDPYKQVIEGILREGQQSGEFRQDIDAAEISLIVTVGVLSSGFGHIIAPTHDQRQFDTATKRVFIDGLRKT
jgi:AcrR family transcriptional regulator